VTEVSRTLAKIDPNVPFTFQSWPEALAFVLFPARVGFGGNMDSRSARLARSPCRIAQRRINRSCLSEIADLLPLRLNVSDSEPSNQRVL
jgi:hypothetical protein